MLTGGQFYEVLSAVVPLYVALFLGYGSLKWWGVVTPEQSVGISRLNAIVSMPALVFEIIAFNDPYTMNNRLIAAYCLANIVVLVVLMVWAWCTRTGTLDWVITLFQLSVMPNTIIVGIPVLSPLYAITGPGIAAIFIGQVLWLFPVLFLYELRAVRKHGRPVLGQGAQAPGGQDVPVTTVVSVNGVEDQRQENGIPALMTQAERGDACRIKIGELRNAEGEQMSNGNSQRMDSTGEMNISGSRDNHDVESNGPEVVPSSMNLKEMATRVGMKMMQLPLTYATILGMIYSLIAGRILLKQQAYACVIEMGFWTSPNFEEFAGHYWQDHSWTYNVQYRIVYGRSKEACNFLVGCILWSILPFYCRPWRNGSCFLVAWTTG